MFVCVYNLLMTTTPFITLTPAEAAQASKYLASKGFTAKDKSLAANTARHEALQQVQAQRAGAHAARVTPEMSARIAARRAAR